MTQCRAARRRFRPAARPPGLACEPGDVITQLAASPVSSAYALLDAVRSLPPGATVAVTSVGRARPTGRV